MQGVLDTINTNPVFTAKIPSTKKQFKFRGYTSGEEQALLVAKESNNVDIMIENTKKTIQECTFGEVDPELLSAFDVEWILLMLRAKSVGEEIELTLKCTKCEKTNDAIINIDDIKMPTVQKNGNVVELNDKVSVIMKYPGFDVLQIFTKEEADMFEILGSLVSQVVNGDDVIEVNELSPEEVTRFIRGMNSKTIKKLTKFLYTSPAVSHTHKMKCVHCKEAIEYEFKGIRNFFK